MVLEPWLESRVSSKKLWFEPERICAKIKIMIEIVFLISILALILLLNAGFSAVNLSILVNPSRGKPSKEGEDNRINFKEAFRLICVARALNKFFFTGSGYIAGSYFSRREKLPFYKTLSAFAVLEFLPVFIWLSLGIYFGAEFAIKIPLILVIIVIALGITIWFKRDKIVSSVKNILQHLKEMSGKILFIMPFIFLNMVLGLLYYFFLFKLFHFYPSILNIIKIVSVSATISYLSPAPTGLGFREAGVVLLLVDLSMPLGDALSLAILDRVIITAFWGISGSILGFDLIKEEINKRFRKKKTVQAGDCN